MAEVVSFVSSLLTARSWFKSASFISCPARLYGAAAKLCDMESLCEDVYRAKDAELTLDALQELVDKGLGGRFLDLRRALEGVEL